MSLQVFPQMEQRSPEWYAARCGIITASAMNALLTVGPPDPRSIKCEKCGATPGEYCYAIGRKEPTHTKALHSERTKAVADLPHIVAAADNDTSRGLVLALAAERITSAPEETFVNRDMERGIFAEPFARGLYVEHCATEPVTEIGFAVRDFGGFKIGYSPDGLVGDDGLIEIKAPRNKGHLSTIVSESPVPSQHMAQLQTGLLVLDRKWIDFISYAGGMHLWPVRVTADPMWQTAILDAAEKAEQQIADHIATYESATKGLPFAPRIDFDKEIF